MHTISQRCYRKATEILLHYLSVANYRFAVTLLFFCTQKFNKIRAGISAREIKILTNKGVRAWTTR